MITLLLAIAVCGGGAAAAHFAAGWGIGGCVFAGLVCLCAFLVVFYAVVVKRMRREMEGVQRLLTSGHAQVEQKVRQTMMRRQMRSPGEVLAVQNEMLRELSVYVREAMARAEEILSRYRLWIPMVGRQIATVQLPLCWQIKDFQAVDRLLPRAFCLDPMMSAIKMARFYMLGKSLEEIRKVYEKGVRRVQYNGNVLLAATMSWIEVKKGDADGAFKTLTEALKKSDNETLRHNHEHLMNNRLAHFSNSGIGDQWYSLFLEEPKIRLQRQRSAYR